MQLVRLQEDAPGDLTDEQRAVNKAAQEAILLRIDLTKKEGEAQTAHAANRKALEDETTLWKSMADTAAGSLEDLFQNGRSASGRLWDQAKSFFCESCAQLLVGGYRISMSAAAASWARLRSSAAAVAACSLIGNLLGGLLAARRRIADRLIGPGSGLAVRAACRPPSARLPQLLVLVPVRQLVQLGNQRRSERHSGWVRRSPASPRLPPLLEG